VYIVHMARFIMFVVPRPGFAPTPDLGVATEEWVARYDAAGIRLDGDILLDEAAGAVVGDGPANPSAAIAGFDILECDDLQHAVAVVEEHPMSEHGAIVIRPFMG
jgi:hypothetical protein